MRCSRMFLAGCWSKQKIAPQKCTCLAPFQKLDASGFTEPQNPKWGFAKVDHLSPVSPPNDHPIPSDQMNGLRRAG